jgi:PmbA protein
VRASPPFPDTGPAGQVATTVRSEAPAVPRYRERLQRTATAARDLLTHSGSRRWEIFAKASLTRRTEIAASLPMQTTRVEETGLAVRTAGNGRTGFAAASGLEDDAARSAVAGAVACEVASSLDPIPPPHFLGTTAVADPPAPPSKGWAAHVAGELDAALRTIDHRLRLQRVVLQQGELSWLLATAEGFVASANGAGTSLLAETVIEPAGEALGGSAPGVWREAVIIHDPASFDPAAAAAQIADRLLLTRGPLAVHAGLRDVILHGEVTAQVLAALAPCFLARADGSDPLPGMVDRDGRLTTQALTLMEDRADPSAPINGPCDGEGLPSRRVTLLDEGIPRHRLASYHDAVLSGEMPRCGALRLSYRDYPSSGIAGLQVVADDGMPPGRMLAETDRALYVLRTLAPVLLDPRTDTYRVVASGVWLDHGRVRGWHPVVELEGGIGQLLRRIEAVGTDLRWYQTDQGFIRASSLLARRQRVVA